MLYIHLLFPIFLYPSPILLSSQLNLDHLFILMRLKFQPWNNGMVLIVIDFYRSADLTYVFREQLASQSESCLLLQILFQLTRKSCSGRGLQLVPDSFVTVHTLPRSLFFSYVVVVVVFFSLSLAWPSFASSLIADVWSVSPSSEETDKWLMLETSATTFHTKFNSAPILTCL